MRVLKARKVDLGRAFRGLRVFEAFRVGLGTAFGVSMRGFCQALPRISAVFDNLWGLRKLSRESSLGLGFIGFRGWGYRVLGLGLRV